MNREEALEAIVKAAKARADIEHAIVTLKRRRSSLTEGQRKEIKKVLYGIAD